MHNLHLFKLLRMICRLLRRREHRAVQRLFKFLTSSSGILLCLSQSPLCLLVLLLQSRLYFFSCLFLRGLQIGLQLQDILLHPLGGRCERVYRVLAFLLARCKQ